MVPDIRWITPLFGFTEDCAHISVHEAARDKLIEMADCLVGTPGLVAIYIPLGTEAGYEPGRKRGRVVGAVRLVKMPRGKKLKHYYYDDLDGSRRWPIGWPCQVVYAPDVEDCPSFREHVESRLGAGGFPGYVSRFQNGPFELESWMRDRLNRDFAEFEPIS